LAEEHPAPFEPDSMFLLGFFSLLDAILDQRMDDLLEEISLDPSLREILSQRTDVEWIKLLEKLDRGDWSALEAGADNLGVPHDLVDKAALEASQWLHDIMSA
jgi:EAL and modified HD-GYP domain-containing signal transduction protein